MKIKIFLLTVISLYCFSARSQTLAEKLGYPAETKLLIIHADDLGVSHSVNEASIKALQKGVVNSASIMIPCPWFFEIAEFAKQNPQYDLGLHLTLTSEWKNYKWGPLTSYDLVSSLLDSTNYFPDNIEAVGKNANLAQVELELEQQINRALKFGINPTHIDAHMGAAFSTPELTKIYIKLAHKYKLVAFLPKIILQNFTDFNYQSFLTKQDVIVDNVIMLPDLDAYKFQEEFYNNHIKKILPGSLNVLLLHAGFDDAELQAITINHPDFGATWRQKDFNYFTSAACHELLQSEKIQLVTWRDIQKVLYK